MRLPPLLLLSLCAASAVTASAAPAVPGRPALTASAQFDVPPIAAKTDETCVWRMMTDHWANLYLDGDWRGLQASVRNELGKYALPLKLNFSAHVYSVVIYTKIRQPEGELLRFLVGDTVTEAFANNLRGTTEFQEIFVTTAKGSRMQSFVNSTPLPNPLEAEITSLLKQVPLTSLAMLPVGNFKLLTREDVEPAPAPPDTCRAKPEPTRHYVGVFRLPLPSNRTSLAIQTVVASPEQTGSELAKALSDMRDALEVRHARSSECLRGLNHALSDAAAGAANQLAELVMEHSTRTAVADVMHQAYNDYVATHACALNETDAMVKLEERYEAAIMTLSSKRTAGTFAHDNIPLRRWNVGAAGGAIISGVGDRRGAVADGKLQRKELRGEEFLSLNVLFHPRRYDPTDSSLSAAERWRLFAGIVTTPDLGLSGGVDVAIFKGFGVATGYALMRVEESTGTVAFGDAVPAGVTATRKSLAGGWFVAFSYKLQ